MGRSSYETHDSINYKAGGSEYFNLDFMSST